MAEKRSLADQIRQAKDYRIKAVEMPEWAVTVYVRNLRLKDLRVFQEVTASAAETGTVTAEEMARLVVMCLCDEHGARIFSDEQVGDLTDRSLESVRKLFNESVAIINMTQDAVEQEKKA